MSNRVRTPSRTRIYLGHNLSLAESAANTYTDQAFELPGTEGAKKVAITAIALDVNTPSLEASQDNSVTGALLLGDKTPNHSSMVTWGDTDVIGWVQERLIADATPDPTLYSQVAPLVRDGLSIPLRATQQGKFYITLAVCGGGNATARTVYCRVEYKCQF